MDGARQPLTHYLFRSVTRAFGIRVKEVFVSKFEKGIFYSEITFADGDREVVVDARTSDALAIALRSHAPIYTTREVIDETGFIAEGFDDAPAPAQPPCRGGAATHARKVHQHGGV